MRKKNEGIHISKHITLSRLQEQMVLSVCSDGAQVVQSEYLHEYTPCPIRVTVKMPNRSERVFVLRLARHGSVENEIKLLPVLAEMGLPVPDVLVGAKTDTDASKPHPVALYSFLSGINLQKMSEKSPSDCKMAAELLLKGAIRLASLTSRLQADSRSNFLRHIELSAQLEIVISKGGPWLREGLFANAIERLRPVLNGILEPPVFTTGDYQPANFLSDGKSVTGFVDFENACYQDFLFGFAKYPIYDLHPLNKSGFISFLLDKQGVSSRDFDIRLALGCLATLQREIQPVGGNHHYRAHVKHLLKKSLENI